MLQQQKWSEAIARCSAVALSLVLATQAKDGDTTFRVHRSELFIHLPVTAVARACTLFQYTVFQHTGRAGIFGYNACLSLGGFQGSSLV